MYDCKATEVTTPKNFRMPAIWFGGENAKTGFIYLHGLSGSAFQFHDLLAPLTSESVMALYLHNRGHDKIGKIQKITDTEKGYESVLVGEAHEVFTDCEDDIQGAVDKLKEAGVEDIYLVGHSTGCQKSIYYLSRPRKQTGIKGVVLICPISDYSYVKSFEDPKVLQKATKYAQKLIDSGKPHELIPLNIWPDLLDAQRFLSLNTPDSVEEIFTYAQPGKKPELLQKVKIPILTIFAGADEYSDRPAINIAEWFEEFTKSSSLRIEILEGALHSFPDHRDEAARHIKSWAAL